MADCAHPGCTNGARRLGFCARHHPERGTEATVAKVTTDRKVSRQKADLLTLRRKYDEALKTIEIQERMLGVHDALDSTISTFRIEPKKAKGTSEATAFWIASDWHIEEKVDPRIVSGLNDYTLDAAEQRVIAFFRNALRLTDLLGKDVAISDVVLALLGDFISGDIHEEIAEVCQVPPMEAAALVQTWIASGIEYVLERSKYRITVRCHSGNHARTTKTSRFSAENGHSIEYLIYRHLAAYFRNEPRVTFHIAEGMHSYLDVYGETVRFQHGHAIKYGGGVGGIYIPVNKAIGQWNKAKRADLDVFGHFHQMRDGGNFLCNGSLIGYNSFALSIKADYEKPRQTLFLMDKDRGRTITAPILVGE
jgi:hypothetical protein